MSDDHGVRELLPGFALGCLDPGDVKAVREHLASCDSCRQELAAFQEVSNQLALGVPQADPPPWLEARVMDRLPKARRPRPRYLRPVFAAAAAVLVTALVAGNILQAFKLIPPRGAGHPQGLVTVALAGTENASEAYGTMVLEPVENRGVLAVRGLQRLDAGHVYQLWLIREGQRVSGGVFSVDADGYGALMVVVPVWFKGFKDFGISIEPAGGSPSPTGARVMGGSM